MCAIVRQTAPLCLGTTSTTGTPTFQTPCSENRRWTFKSVTYAILNVQGSCNNLCSSGACDPAGDPAEYAARKAADIAWLQQSFDEANAKGSAGVMIIWQADPGFDTAGFQGAPKRNPTTLAETDGNPDGFHDLLSKLRELTISFKKPVVLVHGDSHYFMIDKPLLDAQGRRVENFSRVETFGDHTGIDPPTPNGTPTTSTGSKHSSTQQPRRLRLPTTNRARQPRRRSGALVESCGDGRPAVPGRPRPATVMSGSMRRRR